MLLFINIVFEFHFCIITVLLLYYDIQTAIAVCYTWVYNSSEQQWALLATSAKALHSDL